MATINGTLKYKQDDGSIVELNPVGVDSTARTRADYNANAIGTWTLNNPTSSIATVVGDWDLTHYVSGGEDITTVLDRVAADLSNEITDRKNADTALDTRVNKLEPASFFIPLYGFCSATGNNMCTITVPKPAYLRHIEQKGYILSYTVWGGTVGNVLHFFINGEILASSFTPTITNYGDFITIDCTSLSNGIPSIGSVVFGDYTSAAYATSIKVTVSK